MPLVGADVERSPSERKRSGEVPRAAKGRENEEKAAERLELVRLANRCSGEVERLLMMLLRCERVDRVPGGVVPVE